MRVSTPDGWWLLRASNTQAVLVARCESANEAGLERLKADLKAALSASGVSLPDESTAPPLMRFFFYGTLLDRDVASLVLGRRLPPGAFVPAALPGACAAPREGRRPIRSSCAIPAAR